MWLEDFVACLEQSTTLVSRVTEAIEIKEQHLPTRIYKYRCDTSYSRTCLNTDTVWMASPESYNDPFDSSLLLPVDSLQALLETALATKLNQGAQHVTTQDVRKLRGEQIRRVAEGTALSFAKFRELAKVCSFSEGYDSLLMWSHYSNHHTGFCIEYTIQGLGSEHFFRNNLYPVFYSKKFYDLGVFLEALTGADRSDFRPMIPLLGMLHKFDGWSYEREWRLVDQRNASEADYARLAPRPTRVFLGARFDAGAGVDLLSICRARGIPASQMRLADDAFAVVPSALSA
jgi:hypothetical protein